MDHLAPRLADIQRRVWIGRLCSGILLRAAGREMPVAARPVRAAESAAVRRTYAPSTTTKQHSRSAASVEAADHGFHCARTRSSDVRELQQLLQILQQALRIVAGVVAHHQLPSGSTMKTEVARSAAGNVCSSSLRRRLRGIEHDEARVLALRGTRHRSSRPWRARTRFTRSISLLSDRRVWRMT